MQEELGGLNTGVRMKPTVYGAIEEHVAERE
jgi:hypothetical protein